MLTFKLKICFNLRTAEYNSRHSFKLTAGVEDGSLSLRSYYSVALIVVRIVAQSNLRLLRDFVAIVIASFNYDLSEGSTQKFNTPGFRSLRICADLQDFCRPLQICADLQDFCRSLQICADSKKNDLIRNTLKTKQRYQTNNENV